MTVLKHYKINYPRSVNYGLGEGGRGGKYVSSCGPFHEEPCPRPQTSASYGDTRLLCVGNASGEDDKDGDRPVRQAHRYTYRISLLHDRIIIGVLSLAVYH